MTIRPPTILRTRSAPPHDAASAEVEAGMQPRRADQVSRFGERQAQNAAAGEGADAVDRAGGAERVEIEAANALQPARHRVIRGWVRRHDRLAE
ncbi:hypothetical protein [Aurantimonas sp. VKM B-3413]|uniref:hypothetical protein n=1 Tax=Aurantimonas sp. VKM B-3413 TaxID=2779401 RepID=UPI001E5384CA|nr:hypothetical protein [Aurantimonas sp. VKM B-3413]MCB8840233.1 hypothetical protein [Aurantimonas sp. VKM B-3413]